SVRPFDEEPQPWGKVQVTGLRNRTANDRNLNVTVRIPIETVDRRAKGSSVRIEAAANGGGGVRIAEAAVEAERTISRPEQQAALRTHAREQAGKMRIVRRSQIAIAGRNLLRVFIGHHDGDVAFALEEVAADHQRAIGIAAVTARGTAILGGRVDAFEVLLEDDVHHTGDGVRTV